MHAILHARCAWLSHAWLSHTCEMLIGACDCPTVTRFRCCHRPPRSLAGITSRSGQSVAGSTGLRETNSLPALATATTLDLRAWGRRGGQPRRTTANILLQHTTIGGREGGGGIACDNVSRQTGVHRRFFFSLSLSFFSLSVFFFSLCLFFLSLSFSGI